jgi:hypothetical protein
MIDRHGDVKTNNQGEQCQGSPVDDSEVLPLVLFESSSLFDDSRPPNQVEAHRTTAEIKNTAKGELRIVTIQDLSFSEAQ